MKKLLLILMSISLGLSLPGCTTQLWEDTDSEEFIWIDASEITEAELKERGVEYEVYTSDTHNGYLLEKTTKDRFKDYHLRLLGTPVTLVVDAATSVVVVSALILYSDPEGTAQILNKACN